MGPMFSLASLTLAGLFCVSFYATASAKSDHWAGCRGGDRDTRIASCTKIISRGNRETKRNQIITYINRGSAYRENGDFDHAIADLEKALKLDPKSATALTERASIYHAKGDLEHARQDLEAVLTLDPQFVLAKEALDDVNRLIAKSATPPPAPVPAAPAVPATFAIPDRLIVLAVGLLLIIFIVWFFWLKHAIGRGTEAIIFSSRWLVAPFLFGLIVGLAALLYKFMVELAEFVLQLRAVPDSELIIGLLRLVDLSLVGNLILIVICSSYENFVRPINPADHPNLPTGLIKIGFSNLKQKLLGSIVAITAVYVLEWFMDIDQHADTIKLTWVVGILIAFAVVMLLLAIADRLSSGGVHKDPL
jgi:uncharacterized protein (TIGR00645 family)